MVGVLAVLSFFFANENNGGHCLRSVSKSLKYRGIQVRFYGQLFWMIVCSIAISTATNTFC
jgi:hypothetical protein